jgi:thioredoxin 1
MGSAVMVDFVRDDEFEALLTFAGPVVIDFTASWCGPCRMVKPLMAQLEDDYQGRAKVVKIDIDENKVVAKQFGVKSIPAILMFKGGELAETIVGVSTYDKFSEALDKLL